MRHLSFDLILWRPRFAVANSAPGASLKGTCLLHISETLGLGISLVYSYVPSANGNSCGEHLLT